MGTNRIKFFTDTHIAKAVTTQLQRKGVDIIRCEDVNMAKSKDFELLEFAASENRTMVSHDSDFSNLHNNWLADGKNHAGIMIVPRRYLNKENIGRLINALLEYHELIESDAGNVEDDVYNQIIYIR